jgi:hypothetical protein
MEDNGSQAETVDLAVRSNCEVVRREGGRLEFRFPDRAGFLTPTRWEFRDRIELVEYLAGLLSFDVADNGLRGTGASFGKYERLDAEGRKAFTFGDPILDLITDPSGEIIIGGRRIDLAAIELGSPARRSGGNRRIDLTVISDALLNLHVAQAAMGQGEFSLIECNSEVVALASTNPSTLTFIKNGHTMRFRAWKKNYFLYWSMGAEIETWGADFTSAEIQSRYLDTVVGQVCSAVKFDSDSDTDDDYVDEYEWGVNAPQPLRVVSNCSADWQGQPFFGQVSAGPECFEV